MTSERTVLRDPALVPSLGTILGVWAHPDDEAYLTGGLMALARRAGQRVVCVTATRGELGTSDPDNWPPDELAAERTREMTRCLEILGVTEHLWLDRPDGGCAAVPDDEGAAQIARIIERVQPQTVLTFGPDGMTGHSDHAAVCRWATIAFDKAAPAGASLHYATTIPEWFDAWKPIADRLKIMMDESLVTSTPRNELSIDLHPPDDVLDAKIEALRAQRTQTAPLIEAVGEEPFRTWIGDEYFRLARQA